MFSTALKLSSSRFLALLCLAGIGWIAFGRLYQVDANFVAYRFAANLLAGRGLVYWTPDPAVSTYPLVPALLALLTRLSGASLPLVGSLVGAVTAAAGGVYLIRLSGDRWIAGTAYILATAALPSPVALTMLALSLAGLDAARCQRWTLSGVLLGLAILADPSAIILAVLILALSLTTAGSPWRYLVPVVLIPAVVIITLDLTLVPGGLVSVVPGTVTAAVPAVALLMLIRRWSVLRQVPPVAILLAWSAITALLALLGGALPTAAVLPGPIALLAILAPAPVLLVAAIADLILGVLLSGPFSVTPSAVSAGQWIAANTGPQATLATASTGALALYADRPVIDLSGRIQPVQFDSTFFLRYAPDVVTLRDDTPVPWQWFKTTYAQTHTEGDAAVYQRVVNFAPLDNHSVDVNFSAKLGRSDLHLSNVAIGQTLHPGDLVRIRLDWEVAYQPSFDVEIKLNLLNDQGQVVAGMPIDHVPPTQWPVGKVSTYHLITLPNDAPAGRLSLYLGVGIRAGSLGELKVAEVNVER